VSEARARIEELESDKMLSSDLVVKEAVRAAEQDGWVHDYVHMRVCDCCCCCG
jgi:ATP-dependent protease HslVU (ClpYQ) ATPase subunit